MADLIVCTPSNSLHVADMAPLNFIALKKSLINQRLFFGGPDQIRTGVEAFAELCLATRPQDPIDNQP